MSAKEHDIQKNTTNDDNNCNISNVDQEFVSERLRSEHSLKWTIRGFSCNWSELLPSLNFKFTTNMLFVGELSICGYECNIRKCRLELRTESDKYWFVWCDLTINDRKFSNYIAHDRNAIEFNISTRLCCFMKEGVNTLTCHLVHATYWQTELRPTLGSAPNTALPTDMEELFKSKKESDIVFEVAGQKIPAHKHVVVSRCKFFADLIQQRDQQAMAAPNIIVEDFEPGLFNEILYYIYTGQVSSLKKTPISLLMASSKYGLDDLKLKCEYELAANMTIGNAAGLLIIADKFTATYLRRHAMNFIAEHRAAVANSSSWQYLVKNNFHLLIELLYNKFIE